jgi:hypothetical protein
MMMMRYGSQKLTDEQYQEKHQADPERYPGYVLCYGYPYPTQVLYDGTLVNVRAHSHWIAQPKEPRPPIYPTKREAEQAIDSWMGG